MAKNQLQRPGIPQHLLDHLGGSTFADASDVWGWAKSSFVDEGAPLENPDHAHLAFADISCQWTNIEYARQGIAVCGMAETAGPRPGQSKWVSGRVADQVRIHSEGEIVGKEFGAEPDFLITLYAPYCVTCSDEEFCALVEHELYHCGQKVDEFGSPRFSRSTGLPLYAIRGHDVEEFLGVVRRYGAGSSRGVAEMVKAAASGPEVAAVRLAGICGTCSKAA